MSVEPSTVLSLWESAGELLLVAEDALSETSGGAPPRSYVSASEPAFDCCPFLTVYVSALNEDTTGVGPGGVAGGHRTMRGSIILATYTILAVRCAAPIPNGSDIPTVEGIEGVAQQVTEDGWSLWNRIRSAIKCEEIFGTCSEVYFDGGVPIPEQGGCVGWRFIVRAALPGIPRECGEGPTPPPLYTESLFEEEGPLTDPWSSALELGYSGQIPVNTGGVVAGFAGDTGHSIQRPDLGGFPNMVAGVRLSGDWTAADPTNAYVACQLYVDDLNYYEVRFGPAGECVCVQVTSGELEEIFNTTILALGPGAAVGILHESSILQALISPTGDLSSLFAVASQEIAMSLPGDLAPAFVVGSDVAIDMMFTRAL